MMRLNMIRNTIEIYNLGSSVNVLKICKYSQTTKPEGLEEKPKESKRLAEFRKKLRETTPIGDLGEQPLTPPTVKEDPLPPWPDNRNPHTGEVNGPRGPEPTRYGDWERKGRVSDF
ncbi:succinate dehydrogenase assembly factor 4, mitochondrial-like [Pectinophora gossypiella]|uniref:Succinate dehydrogenase assembly factor 4, mitochondrial n=1 Tax=Pectinophora gossypiella TaxID=13191 RepID=A0A1E1WIT3_PECGO|nr:succinate dehydrogenase assembly factor 4, mitochondrial-like [Pectinophora gossypiella]